MLGLVLYCLCWFVISSLKNPRNCKIAVYIYIYVYTLLKKLYNNQRNAQVFNLFYLSIYFCLTCFGLYFSPSSEVGVQHRQWFKSPR
jgi:uncharacterized membrane protein